MHSPVIVDYTDFAVPADPGLALPSYWEIVALTHKGNISTQTSTQYMVEHIEITLRRCIIFVATSKWRCVPAGLKLCV